MLEERRLTSARVWLLRFRPVIFLGLWCASLAVFFYVSFRRSAWSVIPAAEAYPWTRRDNGIGRFVMRLGGTDRDAGPVFYISGTSLQTENARRGIFSTALCKTLTIDDLQVKISCNGDRWESHERDRADAGWRPWLEAQDKTEVGMDPLAQIFDLKERISEALDGDGFRVSLPIDLNNITGVTIRGFRYSLHHDDRLELGVSCRRAVLSGSGSEAVLRGCVTIEGPDGRRLMSNHVRWDLAQNRFTVAGDYIWHRDGALVRGRGTRCDQRLNISAEHSTSNEKGVARWSASMFH